MFLEIQRADGEREVYTGPELKEGYSQLSYPDRGLTLYGSCNFQKNTCYSSIRVRPIDMQYDGA